MLGGTISIVRPLTLGGSFWCLSGERVTRGGGRRVRRKKRGEGGGHRQREILPNPISISLSSSMTHMQRLGESCVFYLGRHSLSFIQDTDVQ